MPDMSSRWNGEEVAGGGFWGKVMVRIRENREPRVVFIVWLPWLEHGLEDNPGASCRMPKLC